MTTTTILVQKDPKNLVPMQATSAQRTVWAQNFTIYDVNSDGTKSAPIGPTVVAGGGPMSRTAAQLAAAPTAADIAIFQGVFNLDTDPTQRYVVNAAGTAYVSSGGSGGTSTIAGATDYSTATLPTEQAAIAGKVSAPTNWAAATNTPALTSGTAVLGSAYKNTSTGVTTLGTAIDGITVLNKDDMLVCFTSGTYTLVPANNIVPPRTEGATVTLAALDNAGISATPVNCVVTVNTGLGAGFGRGFVGAGVVTFNGTATVVDHRTTGATNPACALTCIAADSYYVIGSKA